MDSGHLQTAYCVFGDFSKIDKVIYDRYAGVPTTNQTLHLLTRSIHPQERCFASGMVALCT